MKLLSLEDTLVAAQEAGVPGIEDLVSQVETLTERVAESLAQHLNISCRNTSFWDGKIYTTFLPSQPGQECPAVIDSGDPSGEWEGDGEEEGTSMSMGG
ncbi:hypothetical protein ACFPOU_07780 [Massilia jejuensis]|uniref:Uncharacterized protein n=1 Tax=Massilia jejuensis TaxID=648894 RepID=A0ABW0PFC8_9BURK